jgi:hypothetical protein
MVQKNWHHLFKQNFTNKNLYAMTIEKKDYEFLLLAARFCNKIDNYVSFLGLNVREVDELKEDTLQFAYVLTNLDHYSTCIESFTQHKIQNMRITFSHLVQSCRNSKNYTIQIGLDLGIEIPVYAFQAN